MGGSCSCECYWCKVSLCDTFYGGLYHFRSGLIKLSCILYVTFHVQSAGLEGHIRTNSDIGWHESTTTTNKKSWHGRLSLTCRHHLTGGRPRELGCTQRHEIMMYCFWLHRTRTALCEMKTNSGTAT